MPKNFIYCPLALFEPIFASVKVLFPEEVSRAITEKQDNTYSVMSRKPDNVQLNVTKGLEARRFFVVFSSYVGRSHHKKKGSHLLFRNYFYKIQMILAMVGECTCTKAVRVHVRHKGRT